MPKEGGGGESAGLQPPPDQKIRPCDLNCVIESSNYVYMHVNAVANSGLYGYTYNIIL